MAASRAAIPDPILADLREVRGDDLEPVLRAQTTYWKHRFRWDFGPSKQILRRFLDNRQLHGYAMLAAGRPVGYAYFIFEDGKALVGDLFLLDEYREPASERALLEPVLRSAALYPGVRRIEGQLLSLSYELQPESLFQRRLIPFPRLYMIHDRLDAFNERAKDPPDVRYRSWSGAYIDQAAELIAAGYFGHVDSRINDQYRTLGGARRFLLNTTQHTGCGNFLPGASILALPRDRIRMDGLCLTSRVDHDAAHITQVCVSPEKRGTGLGRELLRRSLLAARSAGCNAASLTVTADNAVAIGLYERFGFQVGRRFSAFVWEAD